MIPRSFSSFLPTQLSFESSFSFLMMPLWLHLFSISLCSKILKHLYWSFHILHFILILNGIYTYYKHTYKNTSLEQYTGFWLAQLIQTFVPLPDRSLSFSLVWFTRFLCWLFYTFVQINISAFPESHYVPNRISLLFFLSFSFYCLLIGSSS